MRYDEMFNNMTRWNDCNLLDDWDLNDLIIGVFPR